MGDPKYLAWLRTEPCAVQPCAAARCEANHSTVAPTFAPDEPPGKRIGGRRGQRQKSADYYAFSLCPRHHGQFHRLSDHFEGWTKEELRRWQEEQSAAYRARYEETTGRGGSPATAATVDTPGPSAGRRGGRSGLVSLIQEVRETCAHYGLSKQVELDFTRIVRRAAEEGTF